MPSAAAVAAAAPSWSAFERALGAIERSDVKALEELYHRHGEAITAGSLPDGSGTLLHYACRKAKARVVGAETPLFWLATIARFNTKTVALMETLVRVLGADVNHRDHRHGHVALTYAVVRGVCDATRRKRVEALLAPGADPRIRDHEGRQPVDYVGMCTDGGEWVEALPQSHREVQRMRALLQDEMHRRDARALLLWARKRGQQTRPQATESPQAVVDKHRKMLATVAAAADDAGEQQQRQQEKEAKAIPVERRLVEMDDDDMFKACVLYI